MNRIKGLYNKNYLKNHESINSYYGVKNGSYYFKECCPNQFLCNLFIVVDRKDKQGDKASSYMMSNELSVNLGAFEKSYIENLKNKDIVKIIKTSNVYNDIKKLKYIEDVEKYL